MSDEVIRDDHAELLRRRALTEDAARPDAVERRRTRNGRTARENIADLVDANSFVEYGRFAIAAQRHRRDLADLIARTPGDGLVAGTARVNGDLFGDERAACAVLSYDYTVLAGTQGAFGHRKKDRLFELIERMRLPTVFFAEGGGGRPGDTDYPVVSALDARAFKLWAVLSGLVPRIAIVKGRCFAGNAVIAGSSDLIVATEDASIGMGGPAMIAGGGLGDVHPDEVGPMSMQEPNGVVDVVVDDEAQAVAVTKTSARYFQGPTTAGDARRPNTVAHNGSRTCPPRLPGRPDHRDAGRPGSVTFLRPRFAPEMVTALRPDRRSRGRRHREQHHGHGGRHHRGRVPTRPPDSCNCATHSGSRSSRSIDCPGYMVGPAAEAEALVRRASRMLVAGAALSVPLIVVVLRRGYGLGAQAMARRQPARTRPHRGVARGAPRSDGTRRRRSAGHSARNSRRSPTTRNERSACVRPPRRRRRTPRRSTPLSSSRSMT